MWWICSWEPGTGPGQEGDMHVFYFQDLAGYLITKENESQPLKPGAKESRLACGKFVWELGKFKL